MKPYYQDSAVTIFCGDCREIVPTLDRFSLLLTDPPYGLKFMGKAWDYDVPDVGLWRVMFEAMKPGAHLFAFAGTRTQHRMAVNIEDAGFEIRDMIAWVYGSGFPKSLDVGKSLDKHFGVEREVVGEGQYAARRPRAGNGVTIHMPTGDPITAPATDAAKQWDGWGTALKPSWESVGCYQKPLTVVGYCAILLSNLTERIDTCRPNASDAAKSSEPSPAGSPEAKTDSAPVNAATRREDCHASGIPIGAADGTSSEADTLVSTSAAESTALNTILSWRDTLAAVCDAARTSTTSTAFETTIDWRTLSFCLSPSMLESTLRAVCRPSGASADALRAARFSTACFACLNSILALSVAAPAMSPEADACRDVGAKPALEPITVARKPLFSSCVNVLAVVESGLRAKGVKGQILWKPENAKDAAKKKSRMSSLSTVQQRTAETSAERAGESGTQNAEPQNLTSSGPLLKDGTKQTPEGSESLRDNMTSDCAKASLKPTAESAPVAARQSATSLPLTTSTEGEQSTESKSTGKFMPNCGEKDSRPDTESFAGIATGLTGSMATARINRDSDGMFIWPTNLPKSIPGKPLTVAENVLAHGTGAINIDGCRVETDDVVTNHSRGSESAISKGKYGDSKAQETHQTAGQSLGRWPANLILSYPEDEYGPDGKPLPNPAKDEVVGLFPVTGASPTKVKRYRRGADNTGYVMPSGSNRFREGAECEVAAYGDSGSAARFFYVAKASRADRGVGNDHPTVKPLRLVQYLITLGLPPGGVLLDPFAGSGTTGLAAKNLGRKAVLIEREEHYCEIAARRCSQEVLPPGNQSL